MHGCDWRRLSTVGDRRPPLALLVRPGTAARGVAGWDRRRPWANWPGEGSRGWPALEKAGGEAGRPTKRSQPASRRREFGDGERPGGVSGVSRVTDGRDSIQQEMLV